MTAIAATAASSATALAQNTVIRSIVRMFGVTALVFLALELGPMLTQTDYLAPWYVAVASVAIFGAPPLLAVAAFTLSDRTIHRALGGYAVGYLALVVLYPLAMTSGPLPIEQAPWPLGITALGTVAAALVWRPALVWSYVLAHVVAMVAVRATASGFVDANVPLQDGFFVFGISAIFTALGLVSMRTARAVDAAAISAQNAAARAVAAIARTREQGRLDALVHDEIMSAFLYASRDSPGLHGAVQRQAARALEQLERVARGEVIGETVAFAEFVDRMRATAYERSPAIRFEVAGNCAAGVPSQVASAFIEATAEAVRNSLTHGGRAADGFSVTVSVSADDDGITVRIDDNGVGFVVRSVESHRLGIRVSIHGRMAAFSGGRAEVRSQPGKGTQVTLEWTSA
jgi:signal transduction histidine kinase